MRYRRPLPPAPWPGKRRSRAALADLPKCRAPIGLQRQMNTHFHSLGMDNFENRRERSTQGDLSAPDGSEALLRGQAEQALHLLSRAGRLLSLRRGSLRRMLQKAIRLTTSYGLASFCLLDLVTPGWAAAPRHAVHRDADAGDAAARPARPLPAGHRVQPHRWRCSTPASPGASWTTRWRSAARSPRCPSTSRGLEEFEPRSVLVVPLRACAARCSGCCCWPGALPCRPIAPRISRWPRSWRAGSSWPW